MSEPRADSSTGGAVRVRGNASPEEVAVLLALLSGSGSGGTAHPTSYERWRRVRLSALRDARTR